MYLITKENKREHDYVLYPRQFDSFRWWKPILTGIFFVIFYMIFSAIALAITMAGDFMWTGGDLDGFLARLQGGYDNMDLTDTVGVILNLGLVVLMLPSLALARAIVRDRSWQSYSSSRGGFSPAVFFRSLLIALLVVALPIFADDYLLGGGREFSNNFTLPALVLVCVLGPLQCIAEEYVFRGFLMQTLGSWVRVPILGIIIHAAAFAALHPYNTIGQISIFVTGISMGLSAWIGRGLEVSSALHIANNMTIFLLSGFGVTEISSEIGTEGLIFDICINAAYLLLIILLRTKTDWFGKVRYEDAGEWNEDLAEKKARKAAARQAKRERRETKKEAGRNQAS